MSRRVLAILALVILAQAALDWWEYDSTSRYLSDLQAQVDVLQGGPHR